MLVDSHCHLDFPEFAPELDAVVRRAGEAGIGWMLTICTHVTKFDQVLKVAETYPNVFCTVGIHPHEAGSEPETTARRLIELAKHPKVVGFGESGLDYFYEHSPRADQQRSFRAHIEAAREAGLPLVVHTRDADEDTGRILAEEQAKGAFKGLLHCFSSGQALAERAVGLGLYISFSGIVTFKKAETLRDTAKLLPMERILVETDAPFLAPEGKRGKRNEPAFTAITAARVASLKGLAEDEFARITTDNFFKLFSKASGQSGGAA
jgi:TatD DNase family protein